MPKNNQSVELNRVLVTLKAEGVANISSLVGSDLPHESLIDQYGSLNITHTTELVVKLHEDTSNTERRAMVIELSTGKTHDVSELNVVHKAEDSLDDCFEYKFLVDPSSNESAQNGLEEGINALKERVHEAHEKAKDLLIDALTAQTTISKKIRREPIDNGKLLKSLGEQIIDTSAVNGQEIKSKTKLENLTCFNCGEHPVYYIDTEIGHKYCGDCTPEQLCEQCSTTAIHRHVVSHDSFSCPFGYVTYSQSKDESISDWKKRNENKGKRPS